MIPISVQTRFCSWIRNEEFKGNTEKGFRLFFLNEGIVNYFELKKITCPEHRDSESLLCEAFELRNKISTTKSEFNSFGNSKIKNSNQ
jgi:hypothetical protein